MQQLSLAPAVDKPVKKLIYENVEYIEHPIYKGYFISKYGQIIGTKVQIDIKRNTKGQVISATRIPYSGTVLLKPAKRKKDMDYLFVVIHHEGKRLNKWVHSLVLETFIGERPPKGVCRHLNNNAGDNSLSNLEWGTQKQNMADKYKHGTEQTGERHPFAKFTWDIVRIIRGRKPTMRYTDNLNQSMAEFNMSESAFKQIYYNKQWHE